MKKFTLLLSAMLLAWATNLWATVYKDTVYSFTSGSLATGVSTNGTFNSSYYKMTAGQYADISAAALNLTETDILVSDMSVNVACGTFGTWSGDKTITLTAAFCDKDSNVLTTADFTTAKSLNNSQGTYRGAFTLKIPSDPTAISYLRVTFTALTTGTEARFAGIKLTYTTGTPSSVANPVFEPEDGKVTDGNFTEEFQLTMTCEAGCTIVYTLDGTDPAESTTAIDYEAPVTIPAKTTVVRAIAMDADANFSNETSATYCYINSAATAYTTTEAIAIIDEGLGLANKLYVKGTISEVTNFNSTYGSLTYTITDGTNPFVIYSGLDIDGAKFTGINNLNVGDEVVVWGVLTKFNETYEMDKNNQLVSRIVKTPIIEADNILFGNIFSTGKTKELVVTGYNLTEAITYTLSEDAAFTVEGSLTTEGGTLTVTFTGTTDDDYSATLTLTSGTVTLPVTISASLMSLTGDGTKENPFTVEDVTKINSSLGTSQKYWVIGYILGSYADGGEIASPAVASNLALGGTADATTFIPVALTSNSAARTALNVADNPGNVGKQVKVCGTLETYFSVAGVKNVKTAEEYEILSNPTAIDNAAVETSVVKTIENGQLVILRDGVKYNAMGVRLQ
ncbi:MAG: DUF6359 domain-containing protein [Paludibacteraceae bacterium]